MRVVSYTRFTTDAVGVEVPANAIQLQTEEIENYALGQGFQIGQKYSDRKHDTGEDGAFLQLKHDGMARDFDMVIITSMYRLGRGFAYADELLSKIFYPAGIHFVVTEDDFYSLDKTAEEVEQYFRDKRQQNFAEKAHDPKRVNLSEKEIARLSLRYGYRFSEDGTELVIDPEAAEVVKGIYEKYLVRQEFASIARDLNAAGVTSPVDRKAQIIGKEMNSFVKSKWVAASVRRILTNEIYTGQGYRRIMKEVIPMTVPAIVDRESFDKVQEIIAKHPPREMDWKTEPPNVLNNLIYDADSGKRIISGSITRTGEKYFIMEKNYRNITKGIIESGQLIAYDFVINFVAEALKEEAAIASIIRDRLLNLEVPAELTERLKDYKAQALAIYEKEQQEDIAGPDFDELESELENLMALVKEERQIFSRANKWMKLFTDFRMPDGLTRKLVRRFVEKVEIKDFKEVIVITKLVEYRDRLPSKWLEQARKEYRDGKEKQEKS